MYSEDLKRVFCILFIVFYCIFANLFLNNLAKWSWSVAGD